MAYFKNYIFPNTSFVDLSLYQFGYEKCSPLHSFGPNIRNHYLFHYVISGKGIFYASEGTDIPNKIYYLEAGQGFLICPHLITTYIADHDEPWEYMWVEFDGLKGKEYLNDAGLSSASPIYLPNNECQNNKVQNPTKKHLEYIINHPDESASNLIGHLYLFFDSLISSSRSKKIIETGDLKDFYVQEALSFIKSHFNEDITVEDIAKRCNLNRNYFSKIFKDVMHCTPQVFIIDCRLSKACELLNNSERSIGDIAAIVGYPNQLHFSKMFKQHYNMSPSEWRLKSKAPITQSQVCITQ